MSLIESLRHDMHTAFRVLSKSPGTTAPSSVRLCAASFLRAMPQLGKTGTRPVRSVQASAVAGRTSAA